jgi:amidophosphoribosyltransferase
VKGVNVYVTFPRITSPCFYGIDMATFGELIGTKNDEAGVAKAIGADKVRYLSIKSFVEATGMKKEKLCLGCLTCKYPTPIAQKMADDMKAKFRKGEKEPGRIYESS